MKSLIVIAVSVLSCIPAFAERTVYFEGGGLADLVDNQVVLSLLEVKDVQSEGFFANCTSEEMKKVSKDSIFVAGSGRSISLAGCKEVNVSSISTYRFGYSQIELGFGYNERGNSTVVEQDVVLLRAQCQVEEFVETSLAGFAKYIFTSEIESSQKLVCRIQEGGKGLVSFKIIE